MTKNILITGSGGLVGSEAVNFFCEKGFKVLGIDNNMRAYYFGEEGSTKENVLKHINLYKNYRHFEIDIRDQSKIEEIFKQLRLLSAQKEEKKEERISALLWMLKYINSKQSIIAELMAVKL